MADRLLTQPLQRLAHMGRQRRAGVDEGLEVGEQALAQGLVGLDIRQQHLEALGDIVIDGRRHVLEVADGGFDRARQRPPLVDIVRAAGRQHEIEVVVAAEGVAPGQPVDQHRRDHMVARIDALQHRLVRGHHLLGVDDALRRSGRAGGEEELGDGVGADVGVGRVDLGPAGLAMKAAKVVDGHSFGGLTPATTSTSFATPAASASVNRPPSLT